MDKQAKEKVQIPRYVADWIKKQKDINESILSSTSRAYGEFGINEKGNTGAWLFGNSTYRENRDNQEKYARAWLDGYEVAREPKYIPLKILPEYLEKVVSGEKTFEIRKNDRDFQVGDTVVLNGYADTGLTGDYVEAEITYITDFEQKDGYVVFGIKLLEVKQ